jgi:hypothetical protein
VARGGEHRATVNGGPRYVYNDKMVTCVAHIRAVNVHQSADEARQNAEQLAQSLIATATAEAR